MLSGRSFVRGSGLNPEDRVGSTPDFEWFVLCVSPWTSLGGSVPVQRLRRFGGLNLAPERDRLDHCIEPIASFPSEPLTATTVNAHEAPGHTP